MRTKHTFRLPAELARQLADYAGRKRLHQAFVVEKRHVTISNEALALFVRFWLTATSPVPDAALPGAQAKGRERYEGFVEALGKRLAKGQSLAREISQDAEPQSDQSNERGSA